MMQPTKKILLYFEHVPAKDVSVEGTSMLM